MKEIKEEHESYAVVGFSRGTYGGSQGGGVPLFGSSVKHRHTVTLTIKRADVRRDLSHDWIHGKEQLIEVEMSAGQFAEAITTLNCGDGVPCTLRYLGYERMPDPPYRDRQELIRHEFHEQTDGTIAEMKLVLADIEKTFSEGTLKKADKERILSKMRMAIQDIEKNLPYVSQCFEKQVAEVVVEARQEIESFMDHAVRSAGISAIAERIAEGKPIELFLENSLDSISE